MRPSSNALAIHSSARSDESGEPERPMRRLAKSWIPACAGMNGRLALRVVLLTTGLALLAGCSEYLDRRDTVALSGGDAVATDKIVQMVDPWPRDSANRNIGFNGQKMQSAVERYRTNRVIQPRGIGTSAAYQPTSSPNANSGSNNTTPLGPVVNQPVK